MARLLKQRFETVNVDSLKPHPRNPNRGNVEVITESVEQNGFYGVILVQEGTNHVLAGNHRLQAAKRAGLTEVPVAFVDFSDSDALRVMLADNRTAEMAHRDETALAELLAELNTADTLEGTGYGEADLEALIASIGSISASTSAEVPEAQADRAAELQTKWQTERGQLWIIPSLSVPGKAHRLLCGDSTNAEDVARLMSSERPDMVWSDPPYGIAISERGKVGGGGHTKFGGKKGKFVEASHFIPIANDETTATAIDSYRLCAERYTDAVHIWWGANYYAEALPPTPCWIVWDKENTGNFADAELAWTNQSSPVRIFRHMWNGMVKASEHGQKRVHPTQKPVALAVWAFEKYGKSGDLIFDPFLGSGMSLVAAEQTGRRCYGVEYEPHYVAVILQRLSDMGLKPELQP